MKISELQNKKIAILWFALEWKSSLNFLLTNGIKKSDITILDQKELENIETWINVKFWEKYLKDIQNYDIIFKTAGYSLHLNPELKQVKDKITTQMQLFFDNYKWKIIAVTASKGKSTISTLIYQAIKVAGKKVKLLWNIWTPVLEQIDFAQELDYVVCEISSYMLEFLNKKNYISILGNVFPEHLDRHDWFENYKKAKFSILEWSEINIVCQHTLNTYENINSEYKNIVSYWQKWEYSREDGNFKKWNDIIFSTGWIKLLWDHNIENICAVLATIDKLWIDTKSLEETIKNFVWLPHRLEYVWNYEWIDFYDDAISTTPQSTIQAIKTLGSRIETIFLWWTDRWYDFQELAEYIKEYSIKNIVLFPPSWQKIKEAIKNIKNIKILETQDMKSAVDFAFQNTQKSNISLLSTASPSYSIRKNFEEKWELFQKSIKSHR